MNMDNSFNKFPSSRLYARFAETSCGQIFGEVIYLGKEEFSPIRVAIYDKPFQTQCPFFIKSLPFKINSYITEGMPGYFHRQNCSLEIARFFIFTPEKTY